MAKSDSVLNYEQEFYLNGALLPGVTNIQGGYSIDESPINIIGRGFTYPVKQGPLVGNFNINKYYIGNDPLLNFIHAGTISGSINYGEQSFGFLSGYLSEYSLSAGIGTIPQVSASIVTYSDIGSGIKSTETNPEPSVQIPNQGSISINSAGYTNNLVTSFDYNLRINRNPIFVIGSNYPAQIDVEYPIAVQSNVSIEASELEVDNIREYLVKPKQHDLSISLKNPISKINIQTFTINDARLLSQSIESSSDDLLMINLSYQGYINKPSQNC